jgi:predicted metal-dependent phosphoesterase TrpH
MDERGGCRIDPHVKVLDDDVVRRAKAAGVDAIVYAPHFTRLSTIERRATRYTDDELLVVPAREIFTGHWRNRKHVLALGLSDPVPDFLTLEDAMAELDRQDAAVLAPHPEFLTVSLDGADVERYADVIDAVEVYNPKYLRRHNRRAERIRARSNHPAFASSYAHLRPIVGQAWTAFEEPLESVQAVVDAFRRGAPRHVDHERGVAHECLCKLEFSHLAWENTWKKFQRVVRPGTESTHPSDPAYEGRFEAESAF